MLSKQKMKNLISKKSKETGLPAQQLYGLYAMDQFVSEISETEYSDYLIIKGGFLLTTSYGLDNRATGDIDFTVRDIALNEDNIEK
ncbi:MAG TPA: nucleotidyl transferase AbiEii/AbiGii toxin family protein, partial [Candidatus Enterococcus avicola]|nr:nucleotidyl transferase AbiEii/AbiGii toxin family protein [Candidatus Enterococcus avicola]